MHVPAAGCISEHPEFSDILASLSFVAGLAMGIGAWWLIMTVFSYRSQQLIRKRTLNTYFGRKNSLDKAKPATGIHFRLPFLPDHVAPPHIHQQQRTAWSWRGGGPVDPAVVKDLSLDRPVPEPILGKFDVSISSIRGLRNYMEDDFTVNDDLVGVFDGHGGAAVSKYLRLNLYAEVQAALPRVMEQRMIQEHTPGAAVTQQQQPLTETHPPMLEDYREALVSALGTVDEGVGEIKHWSYQGSTAVTVWLHEAKHPPLPPPENESAEETSSTSENDDERLDAASSISIVAANIGDSRVVISRNRTAVPLSRDHKPNDPIEVKRINAAGGKVIWHGQVDKNGQPIMKTGVYRVNGNLALSRAIGDYSERPAVTAEPDIIVTTMEDADEFIVLATDGLWDVLSSVDVVAMIHALLRQPDVHDRDIVARLLVEEALRRGSFDNITVVIIWLKDYSPVDDDVGDMSIMDV